MPSSARSGACVYLLSCLFFLVTLAGGLFLLVYIIVPPSRASEWLHIAGMVLVAVPWGFWLLTCLYRTATRREEPQPAPPSEVAVEDSPRGGEEEEGIGVSPVESPGEGRRKVRFGAATVMGGEGSGGKSGHGGCGEVVGGSSCAPIARGSNEESSVASHESEAPLALSMSS